MPQQLIRNAPVSDAATRQSALRILVVEDSIDLRHALHTFLSLLGHQSSCAGSLTTALHLAHQVRFDVLLSDIGLPDGTGWGLLRQMNHLGVPPVHAIAMSGYSLDSHLSTSAEAGFDLHLIKPFEPETLERALNSLAPSPSVQRKVW